MTQSLIYITAESEAEAKRLGRALIDARLAACANVIAGMTSLYRWEGEVQEGREAVLIAKTRSALVERLTAFVKREHGYDCPCVIALPIVGGNAEFLAWIDAETTAP